MQPACMNSHQTLQALDIPTWLGGHPALHLILDFQNIPNPGSMSRFQVLIFPSLVFLAAF